MDIVIEKVKKAFSKGGKLSKIKDLLFLAALALILLIVVWKTFLSSDTQAVADTPKTENEIKLSNILSKIDGVGQADVMICENEDGVESVVVVCEGASKISVVMDIREAVCAALGTDQKAVKIYLLE